MSPRLRKTVTAGLIWLAFLVVVGFVVIDESQRLTWFAVVVPIGVLSSALVDYFVWNRPSRVRRREELRNRPRYGG